MTERNNTLAGLGSRRLEAFLTEITNLHIEDAAAVRRFIKRFADFDLSNERALLLQQRYPIYLDDTGATEDIALGLVVPYVRAFLRAVWVEPDTRAREWALVIFRSDLVARTARSRGEHMSLMDERRIPTESGKALQDLSGVNFSDGIFTLQFRWMGDDTPGRIRLPKPPEELPIEKVFDYLLRHHDRARHCPNAECPAPYFFAARHSQRYCSEICAQSGERETKRRWWAAHGSEWRKKQRPTASKSRREKRDKTGKSTGRKLLRVTRSRKKGK